MELLSNSDFSILSNDVDSGKNPGGIRGFPANVRSMFIATYTALLLYFLFLLLKHLLNVLKKREGPSNYPGGGYEGFRKSRKKSAGGVMAGNPPPPPPGALGQQGIQSTAGGPGMGGGLAGISAPMGGGAGGGMMGDYDDYYGSMTQGVETERGYPGENHYSQALSRAADVSRLGFIVLLGGTVLNALSFDASGAANALAWILFAFIVVWALIALFTPSRWVPLIMSLFVIGLAIPFYAVAFSISGGALQVS